MISEQLLQTKLQIPRGRAPSVDRVCLIERLNNDIEIRPDPIFLAPTRFGKTTLLMNRISGDSCPPTCLSLGENDNDLNFSWSV